MLCLEEARKVGVSRKLAPRHWKGPYVIIRKLSDLLFEIENKEKKTKVVHHDKLKLFRQREPPKWIGDLQLKLHHDGGSPEMSEYSADDGGSPEMSEYSADDETGDEGQDTESQLSEIDDDHGADETSKQRDITHNAGGNTRPRREIKRPRRLLD